MNNCCTPASRLCKTAVDDIYQCYSCYSPIDAEIDDQLRSNEWDMPIITAPRNSFLSLIRYDGKNNIIHRYDFDFKYIYNWCGVLVDRN